MWITLFCSKPPHTWCQLLGERCRCLLLSKHVSDRAPQLLEESTHCFYTSQHTHDLSMSGEFTHHQRNRSLVHHYEFDITTSREAFSSSITSFAVIHRHIESLEKLIFTFQSDLSLYFKGFSESAGISIYMFDIKSMCICLESSLVVCYQRPDAEGFSKQMISGLYSQAEKN